jgi:hypothetical protein
MFAKNINPASISTNFLKLAILKEWSQMSGSGGMENRGFPIGT